MFVSYDKYAKNEMDFRTTCSRNERSFKSKCECELRSVYREIIILISWFFQLNPNKIGNKLFLASFK